MEPFLGQIMMVGFNFAPRGWAMCQGQLLSISSYSALFSLLGTTYGGDGRTTFALPDLRGRCAIGMNQGPGLTDRRQGAKMGTEEVTLTSAEMPSHTHRLMGNDTNGTSNDPIGNSIAINTVVPERGADPIPAKGFSADAANVGMDESSIANMGGGQGHNNMQPFIAMNYIIALTGLFPSR